jgi:hypothetical protein
MVPKREQDFDAQLRKGVTDMHKNWRKFVEVALVLGLAVALFVMAIEYSSRGQFPGVQSGLPNNYNQKLQQTEIV